MKFTAQLRLIVLTPLLLLLGKIQANPVLFVRFFVILFKNLICLLQTNRPYIPPSHTFTYNTID